MRERKKGEETLTSLIWIVKVGKLVTLSATGMLLTKNKLSEKSQVELQNLQS